MLDSLLRFPYPNIESSRIEGIERKADNSVDQAILFIQQRGWKLDAIAWQAKLIRL